MSTGLWFWELARACGLTSYFMMCIAVLTGSAIHLGLWRPILAGRLVQALHRWTNYVWLPFGLLHVVFLLADGTARIRPIDALLPFNANYAQLAIGLGTLSFDVVLICIAAWALRRQIGKNWVWVHRLSYVAFGLAFTHSQLVGSDLGYSALSALGWLSVGFLGILLIARLLSWRYNSIPEGGA